MATIVHRQQNPDGTVTVYYDTGETASYGTPTDPIARAREAGQSAAAQTQAQYGDPWYQSNVLEPLNQQAAAQAQDNARKWDMEAQRLSQQGRTAEAAIASNKAQVELKKAELRQQGQQFGQTLAEKQYEFDRGQQLNAIGMIANARGAGNAAQRIDLGRRTGSFGTQSTALADMAAGRTPQGAFAMRTGDKPTSEADYLSGMLGASAQQREQRDVNDRALASQIGSSATRLARGSVESLSPYERSYLGSYMGAEGFDTDQFEDEYKRAGIMQGRR